MRVAVLGASGFIGARTVELLQQGGKAEPRPVVRSAARLAGLAPLGLEGRIADGFDRAALGDALAGCEAVVHAIAGDPRTIRATAEAAYGAAQDAGVKRMVYLSSAAVHGQDPAPGTDERSPLDPRQPLPYNRAKIDAETLLGKLRRAGSVQIVILRPGIVFGPRSAWTAGLADDALAGRAYLVDGGKGICNALHVDNLVHAIELALTRPAIDGEAYLLGQEETVTWRDFYRPVVEALGIPIERIPSLPYPRATDIMRFLPEPARRLFKVGPGAPGPLPMPSLEKALLHRCRVKLPWTKAQAQLGYNPNLGFDEGCRRSVAWLRSAGYPVVAAS